MTAVSRFLEPSFALTEVEDRECARLLSSVLLVTVAIGTTTRLLQLALVPGFFPGTFSRVSAALGALGGAWALSRTRHVQMAAWVAVTVPMVMTLVQGTIDPDDVSWWAFLLISPLFATMFFSTRVAAVVAALAAVGATAVLVSTRAKLETNRWVAPIAFHLIFAPLLVTAAWHRLSIERKRQAELRARDAALTPQLLAFAKKQPRTPEALDLGALVKGLEPLIRRLVGSAVTVEVRPPAEAAVVIADASHMDQVVMNLVANAREAMPSGGTLTVEVQGSAKEVALTVRDTGEGMDAATQERIFEPFFTTRPGRGGTGLGLATTRSIVEQCGGIITVTSAPGAGAKFRVTLPRSTETPVAGLSRVLAARQ